MSSLESDLKSLKSQVSKLETKIGKLESIDQGNGLGLKQTITSLAARVKKLEDAKA